MNENVRPTLPGIPMLLALIVASLLNVWFYLLAAKLGVLAVLLNVAPPVRRACAGPIPSSARRRSASGCATSSRAS